MKPAYIFDMISRTVGGQLPNCVLYPYDENSGYKIEFYGSLDEVSSIPLRTDIMVSKNILVGDAKHIGVRKNGRGYIAEYRAYAVHTL